MNTKPLTLLPGVSLVMAAALTPWAPAAATPATTDTPAAAVKAAPLDTADKTLKAAPLPGTLTEQPATPTSEAIDAPLGSALPAAETAEANETPETALMDETDHDAADDTVKGEASLYPENLPNFLGFTLYSDTRQTLTERFGDKLKNADKANDRQDFISGADIGLTHRWLLTRYNDQDRLTDITLGFAAKDKKAVLEALQAITAVIDENGVWEKHGDKSLWRTPDLLIRVLPTTQDTFTVHVSAAARDCRETRVWADANPDVRYPRFAGLRIGYDDMDALKEILPAQGCRLSDALTAADGSVSYLLTGSCFGLPDEKNAFVQIGRDSPRITRLIIRTDADPERLLPVNEALKKRYRAGDKPGTFYCGTPADAHRQVPVIWFDANDGRLEFFAPVDGIVQARLDYEAALARQKARRAEAKKIDRLFN